MPPRPAPPASTSTWTSTRRSRCPAVKEPNFFSGPANGNGYPLGRVSELADYEALFDPAYAVRGEASVGYSNYPRRTGVPVAIKELVPTAKFVYMVRDPVARTVSQYQYRVAMEGEKRPLEKALADLDDPTSVYLCPSRYASQLELYLREFPQRDILVVDQADLLADRRGTLSRVFGFLGVDETVDLSAFDEKLNTGDEKRAYSTRYLQLRERIKASPLRLLPRGTRQVDAALAGARLLVASCRPRSSTTGCGLGSRSCYAPEAQRLRQLTGMAFPTWSV